MGKRVQKSDLVIVLVLLVRGRVHVYYFINKISSKIEKSVTETAAYWVNPGLRLTILNKSSLYFLAFHQIENKFYSKFLTTYSYSIQLLFF